MSLLKSVPYYCLRYTDEEYCISYHGGVDILCLDIITVMGNSENRENLMLVKYTFYSNVTII